MATPTFTTWSALYTAMLDSLAAHVSGQFAGASYSINSRTIQYRTLEEMRAGLEWVKTMADMETGTAAARTYAKQGGGGRW